MQIITHKNTALTICQKFFIEKSLELLYMGSIDSYRVKLNNPKSILEELKYCLCEFQCKRIKHFHTIKAKEKDKKSLIDEALSLLDYSPNFLTFNSISQQYVKQLLQNLDEFNYKKLISTLEILLAENLDYIDSIIDGVRKSVIANIYTIEELEKLDKALNILFSELINSGYSKSFLYKLVYGIFVNSLVQGRNFDVHFDNFKQRITEPLVMHEVIFRIDTSQKIYESISEIPDNILVLSDNIDGIGLQGKHQTELLSFNAPFNSRKFIKCRVEAKDYFAALKKARSILSEYLDVINLGLSDEFLQIHSRALVIDSRSPERGQFQPNVNILDGKYKVEKDHYSEFTRKLPYILKNDHVVSETKEKIKSAIRYLRLGNQSTEVEHKFINYWIGLEYLFSNYESQSTINRLKEHFITAHSLAYVKRNVYNLKKALSQIGTQHQSLITSYLIDPVNCWKEHNVYDEIENHLMSEYCLLTYRALKLKQWFFEVATQGKANKYLKTHKANLEIHFTRIYRLRNEIIHDAATNTNNEQITSNLRYYLTFILNELIDFLSKQSNKEMSIEDYFILNEIKLGDIEQNKSLLSDLLDVECSIDFLS